MTNALLRIASAMEEANSLMRIWLTRTTQPLSDPEPIKRYAEAERGQWQQGGILIGEINEARRLLRECIDPRNTRVDWNALAPDIKAFLQRSQRADPATEARSQTKNEAPDLRVKFEGTLRGLDSIIEAHDYSPAMGCCLGNLRIDLVDLGRQMRSQPSDPATETRSQTKNEPLADPGVDKTPPSGEPGKIHNLYDPQCPCQNCEALRGIGRRYEQTPPNYE